MPVTIEWISEPYIQLVRCTGVLTTEEIEQWMHSSLVIFNEQTHEVHSVIDMKDTQRIAANIMKMPSVMRTLSHPNAGWAAVVGTTPLISFWLEVLTHVVKIRFKIFKTIDEAAEFLTALVRIEKERAIS